MLSREKLQSRPSPRTLLARVLEAPELSAQVRALPAPLLGKLIAHVGLEDAGELVALATTEQLSQIFDEELWHSPRAGEDERFDSGRFLLWLEVMLEAGDAFVAARLAELPQDLVTLALHRHVLVVSVGDLRAELTAGDDEAEAAEKAFESCLSEELEDFQLIWRGGDGWDGVLAAILAFDRDHHELCVELLERCASLSRRDIDEGGGLCAVLSAEETLEADLGAERELRRAERGYVAPSAARAFLRGALGAASPETPFTEHDPTTRAYFRELSRKPVERVPPPAGSTTERRDLRALLKRAGIDAEHAAAALLGSGTRRAKRQEPLLIAGLRELAQRDPARFFERSEELAYLSNVLVTGCTVDGQRLRPADAVEHVLTAVSVGLALACNGRSRAPAAAVAALTRYPVDGLFRWAIRRAQGGPDSSHEIDGPALRQLQSLLKRMKL